MSSYQKRKKEIADLKHHIERMQRKEFAMTGKLNILFDIIPREIFEAHKHEFLIYVWGGKHFDKMYKKYRDTVRGKND